MSIPKLWRIKIIKTSKFLLIFLVIFAWIFSGWPQIWQNPLIPPEIQKAHAAGCTDSGGTLIESNTKCRIVLTSGSSFTVPDDWDSAIGAKVELVGGGKGGSRGAGSGASGVGGAGGAAGGYANTETFTTSPGNSISYSIGTGGAGASTAGAAGTNGGNTWFRSQTELLAAGGGTGATQYGTTTYAGGGGGSAGGGKGGSGGGGAAGPQGVGKAGGTGATGGGGGGGSAGNSADVGVNASGNTAGAGGPGYLGTGGGTAGGGTGSNGGGGGGGGGGGYFPLPETKAVFSGKAVPHSAVTLLKDAQIAAVTVAGADANFQMGASGLSAGNYIFGVYSEDNQGRRSSLLTFPVSVTSGTTINIGGIFIAPIIAVDKEEVKRGDNIAIFGQTTPQAEVTIQVSSEQDFFVKTATDANGVYLYNFGTEVLDYGIHYTKSKASLDGAISSFSKTIGFAVGTKTVFAKPAIIPVKGDLNGDRRVNLVDFSIAAYWYKRTISAEFAVIERERLNGDGKVDLVDFSIMAFYWTG